MKETDKTTKMSKDIQRDTFRKELLQDMRNTYQYEICNCQMKTSKLGTFNIIKKLDFNIVWYYAS